MSVAEIDIETIVREVIRRLREATTETSSGNVETLENNGTQHNSASVELADRVVTIATLEGKLTGIQAIVVPARAIITPAARDELKQRKIIITRGESANGISVAKPIAISGLMVGIAASGVCEVEMRKLLGKSVNVTKLSTSETAASVKTLSDAVAGGGRGVLITSTPAAAVMLANRSSGVRAAYGFNFPAIRRAKEEIDANLLVIETAGRSVAEIAGMISEFERSK